MEVHISGEGRIVDMEDESTIVEKMKAIILEKAKGISSEKVVEYGMNPDHCGVIDDPDGYACGKGDCGENLEMFLSVRDGMIEKAKFIAGGCMFTIAACNAAAKMAQGRKIRECLAINWSSILNHLEKLPADHAHCALLAARLFQKALRNYMAKQRHE